MRDGNHKTDRFKTRIKKTRIIAAVISPLLVLSLTGCGLPIDVFGEDEPTPSSSETQSTESNETSPVSPSKPTDATPSPSKTQNPTAPTRQEVVHWYESKISGRLKPVYDVVLKGIQDFEDSIPIEQDNVTKDDMSLIYNTIFAEHPTLFYMSLTYSTSVTRDDGLVKAINPEYTMDKNTWEKRLTEVNNVVDPLVTSINDKASSDYDRELMAHDWLVKNVSYHNDPSLTGAASYQTIYGTFVEKRANCMGYARSMLYLMQKLGISAMVVQGMGYHDDGSSEAHEWNMIKINGEWWQVDVCWDDPELGDDTTAGIANDIRHGYLNLTDREMSGDHKIQKVNALGDPPASGKDSSSVNYYRKNGLYVTSIDQYKKLISDNFDSMINRHEALDVQFADEALFQKAQDKTFMSDLIEKIAVKARLMSWSWNSSSSNSTTRVVVLVINSRA